MTKTSTRKQMIKAVLLFAAIFLANNPALAAALQFEGCSAVSQDHLDTMRGGWVTKNDLVINVGVKHANFVDGVLKVVNSWNVHDITKFRGRSGRFATGTTTVFQNSTAKEISSQGSQSVEVAADFGASLVVDGTVIRNNGQSTLIQNGADNKTIQNLTMIEANVMNSGMVREVHRLMRVHEQMMNSMK